MTGRRRNRRWLFVCGILGAIILVVIVAIVINQRNNNGTTGNEGGSGNTTKTEEAANKPEEKQTDEKKESGAVENKTPQYEGESPNKSESLTGIISYAGVSGGKLLVRANIDQYLTSGKCKLNLVKDGVTVYNKEASIVESVTTSTCDGFEIAASELNAGDYTVEIILESGEKYGKILGEVKI